MDTTTIVFGIFLAALIIAGFVLLGYTPNRPVKETVKKSSKVTPPAGKPVEEVKPAIVTTVVDNTKTPSKVLDTKTSQKQGIEYRQDVPKPAFKPPSKPLHTYDAARVKKLSEIFAIPFDVRNKLPNATWVELDAAMQYIEQLEAEYTTFRQTMGSALSSIRAGVTFAEEIQFKKEGLYGKIRNAQTSKKAVTQTVGKSNEPAPAHHVMVSDVSRNPKRNKNKI